MVIASIFALESTLFLAYVIEYIKIMGRGNESFTLRYNFYAALEWYEVKLHYES